ncbi:hypothetical protein Ciccas_011889, partial [Cichlidogyrus casuarinus]
ILLNKLHDKSRHFEKLGGGYAWNLYYRTILHSIVQLFLPVSLISVLNLLLIWRIRKANMRRLKCMISLELVQSQCQPMIYNRPSIWQNRTLKLSRSRSSEVNRICVTIIIIFLICEFPSTLSVIFRYIGQESVYLNPLVNFFVTFNSGVNFFVYVFLGRRFRHFLFRACERIANKSQTSPVTSSRHKTNIK